MSSIGLIARADLRRRWGELVLLGLLVALTTGITMAASVAAERASTSIDRFLAESQMSTADFPLDADGADRLIETLRGFPDVEAVAVSSTLTVFVGDDPASGGAGFGLNVDAPDPIAAEISEAVFGIDIDRPLILEGRLPTPDSAEEILLYEWIAEEMGWEVGHRLTGQTFAAADADDLFGDGPFPGVNGPMLDLVVVGIGRSGREIAGEIGDNMAGAYGSASLMALTRDEAMWWPPGLAVRTRNGVNEFDLLSELEAAGVAPLGGAEFGGEFVGGVTDARAAAVQTATNTVDTMAVGLAVLAAGVAAAGMIVVGQAVVRHVAGAARMRATLFQLGQSRRATATAIAIPVLAATTAGVAVGAAAAIVASAHLPTGLARRAEVDPGVWVRPDLIIPIGVAAILFAAGFCFVVAAQRTRSPATTSTASVAGRLARLDPPPAVGAGVRLALDRGRGPRSLPTRSAFIALSVGVIAATAALVIAQNVDQLTTTPARWGWNWSSMPIDAGGGAAAGVAAEPGVEAVGFFAANGVSVDGVPMGGFTIEQLAGDLEFTVRDGRLPDGPGEVALGARTLRRIDVEVGDTVSVADFVGANERTMTVVGSAVFPYEAAETLDDGAVLLPETLFDLTDEGAAQRFLLVRYDDAANGDELEAVLAAEHGLIFDRFTSPHPPAQVRNLSIAKQMAVALAVFFVALGAMALTHVIVVSSRRRRLDLAVLRALGFVRRQVRVAFLAQSLVFGVVAAAVGVPLGLVVGGGVWRAVTDDLGAVTSSTVSWPTVLGVVPAVLAVAALVSWWPGRAASRQDPTDALRAE